MDTNKQKAFVVHSKPYKETSLIVTFLTERDGKVDAVAKGAKRKKSKFSGNLEPFQLLNIDYGGRSNLKTLFLAESIEPYKDFVESENLFSAFYVNELINFLLPYSDESTELFKIYQDCIQNLKAEKNIEVVLRIFELQVLSELGYEINLQYEYSNGEPILEEKKYSYRPESGFYECSDGHTGKDLIGISSMDFSESSLRVCKVITRQTFDHYFSELNIQSRVFFK